VGANEMEPGSSGAGAPLGGRVQFEAGQRKRKHRGPAAIDGATAAGVQRHPTPRSTETSRLEPLQAVGARRRLAALGRQVSSLWAIVCLFVCQLA